MALERRLLLSTFKVLFDCTKFIVNYLYKDVLLV